jgi:epoxyqueuosine reductase
VSESAHPTLTPTIGPAFQPRAATTGRRLEELAMLTEEEFRAQFKGSPVKRAKRRGFVRNAAAALAAPDVPEPKRRDHP